MEFYDAPPVYSWAPQQLGLERSDDKTIGDRSLPEYTEVTRTERDSEGDNEDALLEYAIMLSLQAEDPNTAEGVDNEEPSSHTSADEASDYQSCLSSTLETSSTSRFLSLPEEMKQMICAAMFEGQQIIVKPGKGTNSKLMIVWADCLKILLLCREINVMATRHLIRTKTIIDLRQYRRVAAEPSDASFLDFDVLLPQSLMLRSMCTKLMIRQGQDVHYSQLDSLLPDLKHFEVYDYKSCPEVLRENRRYPGNIFEYIVPNIIRVKAAAQLQVLRRSLPPGMYVDVIYVCDTLMCIPRHDSESTSAVVEHGRGKACTHAGVEMKLSPSETGQTRRASEGRESIKQAVDYKTAKMRHLVIFNKSHPNGTWLSKDWVVAGLSLQSLSCGEMNAIHCHEYCNELIERGETVGV